MKIFLTCNIDEEKPTKYRPKYKFYQIIFLSKQSQINRKTTILNLLIYKLYKNFQT